MSCNYHSHRTVLSLMGKDRYSFLQGLITNDISSLQEGSSCWTAFLNTQGRIQNLFFIFSVKDAFLIDIESQYAEVFCKQLRRFRLRADVKIDITSIKVVTGFFDEDKPLDHICCTSDPRYFELGWRSLLCQLNSDVSYDNTSYNERRLLLGIPEMSDLLKPGQTLALEANMDALNGISWEKGCYLGQEITARMKYRSHAKRRLLPVLLPDLLSSNDKIISMNGKPVGDLRSHHEKYGIAMLHHTAWTSHDLKLADKPIEILWPKWLSETLRHS